MGVHPQKICAPIEKLDFVLHQNTLGRLLDLNFIFSSLPVSSLQNAKINKLSEDYLANHHIWIIS